jgi:Tol biopolymer transport system component
MGWTADRKLVYGSNDGGSYDLYVSDADGSDRKQLTFDRDSNETQPAASPDGRYDHELPLRRDEATREE